MNYELYHHGILGMHWGIRRYQNPDGSLTPAGQKRYKTLSDKEHKNNMKAFRNLKKMMYGKKVSEKAMEKINKKRDKLKESIDKLIENAPLDQKLFRHMNNGEKYALAATKGRFDIVFTEITQNENWSDKKSLSEYRSFLNDPEKYREKLGYK